MHFSMYITGTMHSAKEVSLVSGVSKNAFLAPLKPADPVNHDLCVVSLVSAV